MENVVPARGCAELTAIYDVFFMKNFQHHTFRQIWDLLLVAAGLFQQFFPKIPVVEFLPVAQTQNSHLFFAADLSPQFALGINC